MGIRKITSDQQDHPAERRADTRFTEPRTSIEEIASRIQQKQDWIGSRFNVLVGALRAKESTDRLIWRGLVRYANADLNRDAEAYEVVIMLAHRCTPKTILVPPKLDDFEEINRLTGETGQTTNEVFRENVLRYQPQLRSLLTWLCVPQAHPDLGREAIRFLQSSVANIQWEIWENDPNVADENADDYSPVFYSQCIDYKTIMDPIGKFIFDQLEKFQNEELKLNEAVPVRVCKRQPCGRFFLPERKGRKDYCSDQCCALDHERSKEENRDYMWVHRLEEFAQKCFGKKHGFKAADFHRKLESPKVERRLREIENHWQKDWPEIVDKISALRRRVPATRRIN